MLVYARTRSNLLLVTCCCYLVHVPGEYYPHSRKNIKVNKGMKMTSKTFFRTSIRESVFLGPRNLKTSFTDNPYHQTSGESCSDFSEQIEIPQHSFYNEKPSNHLCYQ